MDAFSQFKVTMRPNEANRLISVMNTPTLELLLQQWKAVRCSNQYVVNWARIMGMIENELGYRGEYARYTEDVSDSREDECR